MTQVGQTYRCDLCGNEVQVIHEGGGELVCCGQDMVLVEPEKTEAA